MAPAHKCARVGNERLKIVKSTNDATRHSQKETTTTPKVLRIGVVERGRIVDEKIIDKGKNVTIGHSERNDFVVIHDSLPARFPLFEHRGSSYSMSFSEDMEGRVSYPGGFSELSVLKSSGKARRRGRVWTLELDYESRGKVRIGETTLLFQMVTPPAIQPRPQLPTAVRGGWLKSIDWFFTALIFASFVAQFGIVVWLVQRDWPIHSSYEIRPKLRDILNTTPPSQADIQARLKKLTSSEKLPSVAELPPQVIDDAHPQVVKRRPRQGSNAWNVSDRLAAREQAARAQQESADRVRAALSKSAQEHLALAGILGSNGGQGGAIVDVLKAGGGIIDQDAVMSQVQGIKLASPGTGTIFRQPSGCKENCNKQADFSSLLRTHGNRKVGSGNEPLEETAVQSRVKRGPVRPTPQSRGILDEGEVRRVVGRGLGGIKACYERSLRRQRNLRGRVTINFTIGSGGRVTRAQTVQNTLGAPEVGTCIETRFRSFRFPAPDGGAVTFAYPFLFEPSN